MKSITLRIVFSCVITLFLVLTPCGICAEEELILSSAASLTNVFKDIAESFEESHKGMKIHLNFASSGALLHQIAKGAPVDIFASADQKTMDMAQEKNLIDRETRKNFVENELVLIVPKKSDIVLKDINDLAQPSVKRIALGNPLTVPAGRYAQESLVNHGLWDKLSDKYIFGNHVRQVLDYVNRGEVDAGFVYLTDAKVAREKVRTHLVVTKHAPVLYSIAIIQSTHQKELAQSFLVFIETPKAREIFKKYGFKSP
jgi:molybdate transport system substrate-binding protein